MEIGLPARVIIIDPQGRELAIEDLVTVREAAALMGMTRQGVHHALARGALRCYRVLDTILIERADAEAYAKNGAGTRVRATEVQARHDASRPQRGLRLVVSPEGAAEHRGKERHRPGANPGDVRRGGVV